MCLPILCGSSQYCRRVCVGYYGAHYISGGNTVSLSNGSVAGIAVGVVLLVVVVAVVVVMVMKRHYTGSFLKSAVRYNRDSVSNPVYYTYHIPNTIFMKKKTFVANNMYCYQFSGD